MTPDKSLKLESDLTLAICKIVNSPRALAIKMMVEHQEWEQLVQMTIEPRFYENPRNFAEDYLVTKVMSKSQSLPTSWDTRKVAIEAFLASERLCHETNHRLQSEPLQKWERTARRWISRILGPLDRAAIDKIVLLSRHGPGGSVGVRADGLVPSDKFDSIPTVTPELAPFASTLMGESWFEYRPHVKEVVGSQFFTVPKNAKTDRSCAKEPTLNVYFQLGIGIYIARRLKRFGVDISDQTWNQHLASMAQELGLATLDLSMASDLISTVLVFRLLPRRWQYLLSLARSRFVTMSRGDEPILLEKFSTMGNGFTFALETLVFFAVCKAICPEGAIVSAYGDDLVVPQRNVMDTIDALEFLGFKVNRAKSCLAGRFFESCGTDWFDGINVRPFFLTGQDEELHVPYLVTQANALRRWSNRLLGGVGCEARYMPVWNALYEASPAAWQRCVVPLSAGDVGFISTPQYGSRRWDHGYQRVRYRYRRIRSVPERVRKTSFGVELAILAGARPSSYLDSLTSGMYEGVMAIAQGLREEDLSDMETRGFENPRGLYGLSRPGWAWCDTWPDGLDWV